MPQSCVGHLPVRTCSFFFISFFSSRRGMKFHRSIKTLSFFFTLYCNTKIRWFFHEQCYTCEMSKKPKHHREFHIQSFALYSVSSQLEGSSTQQSCCWVAQAGEWLTRDSCLTLSATTPNGYMNRCLFSRDGHGEETPGRNTTLKLSYIQCLEYLYQDPMTLWLLCERHRTEARTRTRFDVQIVLCITISCKGLLRILLVHPACFSNQESTAAIPFAGYTIKTTL